MYEYLGPKYNNGFLLGIKYSQFIRFYYLKELGLVKKKNKYNFMNYELLFNELGIWFIKRRTFVPSTYSILLNAWKKFLNKCI